MKSIAPAMWSI